MEATANLTVAKEVNVNAAVASNLIRTGRFSSLKNHKGFSRLTPCLGFTSESIWQRTAAHDEAVTDK